MPFGSPRWYKSRRRFPKTDTSSRPFVQGVSGIFARRAKATIETLPGINDVVVHGRAGVPNDSYAVVLRVEFRIGRGHDLFEAVAAVDSRMKRNGYSQGFT